MKKNKFDIIIFIGRPAAGKSEVIDFLKKNTLFIEFSRGGYNGYRESLSLLNKDVLKKAVVFYIKVSFKEAVRKNKKRYNPNQEDSILYHIVPFKVMNKYKTDDWEKITLLDSKCITIKGIEVPYTVFNNEPEKTNNLKKIRKELLRNMDKLLKNYKAIYKENSSLTMK